MTSKIMSALRQTAEVFQRYPFLLWASTSIPPLITWLAWQDEVYALWLWWLCVCLAKRVSVSTSLSLGLVHLALALALMVTHATGWAADLSLTQRIIASTEFNFKDLLEVAEVMAQIAYAYLTAGILTMAIYSAWGNHRAASTPNGPDQPFTT